MRSNYFQMSSIARGALLLGLALSGCDKFSAAEKAPVISETACKDYGDRLCKEAGAESATCTSARSTLALMPKAACAAGLKEIDFTVKQLASAHKKCDELVTKLCAEIGPKTETCEMVTAQTKGFPPERCDMMMQHYAEVVADLKKREDKNKPLAPEKVASLSAGTAPSFGPADAKVTLVEFSDFQCPFCSRAATTAHQIKEKYGTKVRFVFRQFPLSFHQNAHVAAEASLFANSQGKFWEFHDKAFTQQDKLDRPSLEALAKDIGLNVAELKKALDAKTFAATVDAEMKLGESVAVDGTPTLFLNGARVSNPTDFDAIAKQIDAALGGG